MFQNIVAVLDDALKEIILPQHLKRSFREFITDLNAVARQQHFECHVRGTSRPHISHSVTSAINPSATTPQSKNKTQIDSAPKIHTSYSKATKNKIQEQGPQPRLASRPPITQPLRLSHNKTLPRKPQEDNRILVRLSLGHTCLSMSLYAIMLQLHGFLEGKSVREIKKLRQDLLSAQYLVTHMKHFYHVCPKSKPLCQ
ncbi:hypothetical protein EV44_g3995 [Erysiphe necator]|uniref:Uncharacterized protein n=1 Tax=Uncinula necator TaxID=52586 RepID=A0A0B1P1T5_UNCNE|nr:hypothetical protein EV44_g3995 [Erysiphe necator]